MRKYLPLFLLAFASLFIYSCDDNNDVPFQDYDTIGATYDITNPVFTNVVGTNAYEYVRNLPQTLQGGDMILFYVAALNGDPVWKPMPYTFYPSGGGVVDYTGDFSSGDIALYVDADFALANTTYISPQRKFRIVIVPADHYGNLKMANGSSPVDLKDYNAVIKYFNIDDSKTKVLK